MTAAASCAAATVERMKKKRRRHQLVNSTLEDGKVMVHLSHSHSSWNDRLTVAVAVVSNFGTKLLRAVRSADLWLQCHLTP